MNVKIITVIFSFLTFPLFISASCCTKSRQKNDNVTITVIFSNHKSHMGSHEYELTLSKNSTIKDLKKQWAKANEKNLAQSKLTAEQATSQLITMAGYYKPGKSLEEYVHINVSEDLQLTDQSLYFAHDKKIANIHFILPENI